MERQTYRKLDEIALDPLNPRLGRALHREDLSQAEIYDAMKDWSLEELATSFLESGFWPHEAILCIEDKAEGKGLIAIEGNRRIAALIRLRETYEGRETSPRWKDIIAGAEPDPSLFTQIPVIVYPDRASVDAFLGFRHVTGIKEWAPPEKAQFISKLIKDHNLDYRQVMRKIGSRSETVERNYVAFTLLQQMEGVEGIDIRRVEQRFSVLFLSLRSSRVRKFLGIEDKFGIEPSEVPPPVGTEYLENLRDYAKWLFGDETTEEIVKDSRQIDQFAKVLSSAEAVDYLRTVRRPTLDRAYVLAGGDQEETIELLKVANFNIQESLTSVHLYSDDEELRRIAGLVVKNSEQLRKALEL